MEQDPHDYGHENELPTYNELAAESGPNSRFGRWKGWVEKRAAERYAEDTPERRQARRLRGWGPHVETQTPEPLPLPSPQLLPTPSDTGLNRTQTILSDSHHPDADSKLPSTSPVTRGQALPPTHLKLHSFGSRFLPHSEQPILSLLPLFDHQKLLLGHMDGLTLLDMDPEPDSTDLQSREPRRRDIWHGEGVYQMTILEHEQPSLSQTPVGVVLALVGTEPLDSASEKETKEPFKTIRMYNLASLADLVRWAAARKDPKPLDLSRPSNLQPHQKKHKRHLSVSKGFMSPKTDSRTSTTNVRSSYVQSVSTPPPPPPKDWPRPSASSPPDSSLYSIHSADSWEVVEGDDDVPLRWATDFVPLASPSSRLANQSVHFFELHKSTDGGRVTARLAVATRQNILLYETVRGERAFRFVKEFYTPIPARGLTFVTQNPNDTLTRTLSPSASGSLSMKNKSVPNFSSRRVSSPMPMKVPETPSRTWQLSLFVVFEKKAGLIKIADSSVGELELWEEPGHSRRASSISPMSAGSSKRPINSPDSPSSTKDLKGPWAPPAEAMLPLTHTIPRSFALGTDAVPVYFLTRGKSTHIVPSPLPMPLAAHAPLAVLKWGMRPSRVVPRVCESPSTAAPFLQVTALGEDGVEVQELALAFLRPKGKERETPRVMVQAAVGPGGAGFLCMGGHWTEAQRQRRPSELQRQWSTSTVDTVDLATRRDREAGFYAWTQYAIGDWRVFWLGGDANDGEVPPTSP